MRLAGRRRLALAGVAVAAVLFVLLGLTRSTGDGGADGDLDPEDAFVVPAEETVEVPTGSACDVLPSPGTTGRCEDVDLGDETGAWVIEQSEDGVAATVAVRTSDTEWEVVLRADAEATAGYTTIDGESADLDDDGIPEVVIVYGGGENGRRAVDVVDLDDRSVLLHADLDRGRHAVIRGALHLWEVATEDDEGAQWRHRVITFDGGVKVEDTTSNEAPPPEAR